MTWFSYTVVKFIPDPVKDERVNIGVIVLGDDGSCKSKFVKNFNFIKKIYSISDVDLLEFVLSNYDYNKSKQDVNLLQKLYENSIRDHRIKVESPRAINSNSILVAVDELFLQMISIPEKQHISNALTDLDNKITKILYKKIKMQRRFVKRHHCVSGKKTNSKYDYVFMNGHVTNILQRISFDILNKDHALQKVKSFVYDSIDIHEKLDNITCVAYVPTPKKICEQHVEAVEVLKSSKYCTLVDDNSLETCLVRIHEKHTQTS